MSVDHFVVYPWNMGLCLDFDFALRDYLHIPPPPPFTSQAADATLQTSDRSPEQLNRFILVSIHSATCQHGDGREGRL